MYNYKGHKGKKQSNHWRGLTKTNENIKQKRKSSATYLNALAALNLFHCFQCGLWCPFTHLLHFGLSFDSVNYHCFFCWFQFFLVRHIRMKNTNMPYDCQSVTQCTLIRWCVFTYVNLSFDLVIRIFSKLFYQILPNKFSNKVKKEENQ